MSIFKGIIDAWLDHEVAGKSISKDKVGSSNMVFSNDNELIESKLDEILHKLGQCDNNGKSNLLDFVYDIVNRKEQIYSLINDKYHLCYSMSNNGDYEIHHFELISGDNKHMIIDAKTTVSGDVLEFRSMYHSDISDYLIDKRQSSIGTTVINVSCPIDGDVFLEDKIYSVDLLNNSRLSTEFVDSNLLSEYHASLGNTRVRK